MKKIGIKKIALFIFSPIVVGALLFGFFVGREVGVSQSELSLVGGMSVGQPAGVDFESFWDAWKILDERFVTSASTTPDERLWGAIKGLAESYGDPYTTFFPPEDTKLFNETISGNFGGVGIEIGIKDDILTVVAPLEGTPAKRAGIRAGDQIIGIDDLQTGGVSIERAVRLIRGEVGTSLALTLYRPSTSETMVIDVVRGVIQIPTLNTTLRPDGIFVIELYNFSAPAPALFQGALREFAESGSTGLVIDLRGNPGGFLSGAIDIASWFLPIGKVVAREDFGKGLDEQVHRSRGYDVFTDAVSIVVLVDGGSASASEILAGALQEHGKAQLVGTQTFGKGSVQELIPLTADSTLKVTIAKWLTPNGISISDGGLTPDNIIEITQDDVDAGRDLQMERAVEILHN
jgi:carboxyl-terminal processing protease